MKLDKGGRGSGRKVDKGMEALESGSVQNAQVGSA